MTGTLGSMTEAPIEPSTGRLAMLAVMAVITAAAISALASTAAPLIGAVIAAPVFVATWAGLRWWMR